MKKILYLSQVYPYPPDGGGKIKTLATLRALAKKFEVYAIFVSEKKPSQADLTYLKNMGLKKVKVFYNYRILDSVKDDLLKLAGYFVRGIPHYVFQYTLPEAFPFIQQAISHYKPDVIHIDHLNMAQYLPAQKKERWILEHHNLEFYLLWTRFVHSGKWSRKLYLLIETVLTYWFERRTLPKFDHIFAISKVEAQRAKQFFKVKSISPQPLIYSVAKKKGLPAVGLKNSRILFIGNLAWPPNEDAVEWFLTQMWPGIHKALPQTEFHVVGKNNPVLSARLPKLPKVFLHGYQKEIEPFLRSANLFVLPFRMGGGVRLKALTALSHGLPMVSTPLGVEGLDVKSGREVVIAQSTSDFISQSLSLLSSPTKLDKVSKQAIQYLKKHHGLQQNNGYLKEYQRLIQ